MYLVEVDKRCLKESWTTRYFLVRLANQMPPGLYSITLLCFQANRLENQPINYEKAREDAKVSVVGFQSVSTGFTQNTL